MSLLTRKINSTFVKWFLPRHKTEFRTDMPDTFEPKILYVIGERNYPWLIGLTCPCGCGAKIFLNLLPDANPRWKFNISSKKRITLSPSVWRTQGCKSHFFIRNNKIDWVYYRFVDTKV